MASTNTNTESSTTVTTGPTISNVDTNPPTLLPTPRSTSQKDMMDWEREVEHIRNTSTDPRVLSQFPPKLSRQINVFAYLETLKCVEE